MTEAGMMSEIRDLEEYSDTELQRELSRRDELRRKGLCSYCRNLFNSNLPCRHHERPDGEVIMTVKRIMVRRYDL